MIVPAEEGTEYSLCFYDVLSGHFIQVPEDGQPILDLIVKLWSQSFASHIFALLFHKWVCQLPCRHAEVLNSFWCIYKNIRRYATRYFWSVEGVEDSIVYKVLAKPMYQFSLIDQGHL